VREWLKTELREQLRSLFDYYCTCVPSVSRTEFVAPRTVTVTERVRTLTQQRSILKERKRKVPAWIAFRNGRQDPYPIDQRGTLGEGSSWRLQPGRRWIQWDMGWGLF